MDETITVSLPQEILEAAEREREARGETRSQFFRRAVENLLREDKHDAVRQYIQGYRDQPETDEEEAAVQHIGINAIAQNPWE